jgi:hypothetical protein
MPPVAEPVEEGLFVPEGETPPDEPVLVPVEPLGAVVPPVAAVAPAGTAHASASASTAMASVERNRFPPCMCLGSGRPRQALRNVLQIWPCSPLAP